MKRLLERWGNFLLETRDTYHIVIEIIAEKDTKLYGSIFNKIRAIPGVTIVKTVKSSKENTLGNKVSRLDIKFLIDPNLPGNRGYIEKVRNEIKLMKDDQGDRVLSVTMIEPPKKLPVEPTI
jgi:hypothetical protein